MDEKRERRFYQKLETLEDRLTFIEENFPEITDPLAFESVQEVLPSFWVFGSMVREWLKNR